MSAAQVEGAAPAKRGATSAAAARVRLSASRYLGLSRKVRSPEPAWSSAATSWIVRPASAPAASVAPHQLATSASEGAELGGKKRILANCGVPSEATTGAPALARPLDGGAGRSALERRAAREVEELGLVVLALRNRDREVEPDRPHGRGPDQARADRGADLVRVPHVSAADLGDGERRGDRSRWRAIGIAEEIREVGRTRISDQTAGVGKHRAF